MILLISGCSQTASTNAIEKDTSKSGIHEITYEELQKELKSDNSFILYIGRPDCGDCKEFYPILENYIKENEGTYVYYLNVQAFRDASRADDASEEEKQFYLNIQEELSFEWTPTLHLFEEGKVVDTYTYLDMDFYKIKDKKEQESKKEEFIDKFKEWMNEKYK